MESIEELTKLKLLYFKSPRPNIRISSYENTEKRDNELFENFARANNMNSTECCLRICSDRDFKDSFVTFKIANSNLPTDTKTTTSVDPIVQIDEISNLSEPIKVRKTKKIIKLKNKKLVVGKYLGKDNISLTKKKITIDEEFIKNLKKEIIEDVLKELRKS